MTSMFPATQQSTQQSTQHPTRHPTRSPAHVLLAIVLVGFVAVFAVAGVQAIANVQTTTAIEVVE
ncbi:MAG: hypothetical protein H7146_08245 [Burkholderiaceae bacterium]|nr:hypothetical protein [Microbacteriaceae bacterium]